MHRKAVGALLCALAVGMTACGDSEPSARDFRAQARAVCADVTRRVHELQEEATRSSRRSSLTRAADAMDDGLERLRALDPPEALADRYEELLAWKESQRDAALAIAEGGEMSARSRLALDAHDSPLERLTLDLGLRGCF